MQYKMGMRLILFSTVWDIRYLVSCPVIANYDAVSPQISCRKWNQFEEIDKGL